ncbi:MAG: glycoside hydrolase family 3 C-terminal domain-containing protein [Roseburia sp.]|nr:glycoside hydrolase family 3 C-terminal domain-containing protein [Roseburia sp.]
MTVLTKARFESEPNEREKHNLQVAYEAACESIVLLENDGTLPIKLGKVALYGAGAKRTVKGGGGSGEVNERHSVTVYEGMIDAGFTITSEKWLNEFDAEYEKEEKHYHKNKLKNIITGKMSAMAALENFPGIEGRLISEEDVKESDTDTCIYVLSRQAGEGIDRRAKKGDMFVTDKEEANIAFCAKHYKKFILLINAGAQLDVSFLDKMEGINAVLFICQLGTAGGMAVADILSGKVSPSGKLASTWAMKYSDIPFSDEFSYLNGNLKDEYYKEGIYVGYRYFDTFNVEPRYPFGYGLSYTEFEMKADKISVDGTMVFVDVEVKNIGALYAGKEVAEVYISAPAVELDKEYQSLAGFAKTKVLAPGESTKVKVAFDMCERASYREEDASFVLEEGDYIVRLGNSSRNTTPCAILEIEEEVVVSKHQNICKVQKTFEELKAPKTTKAAVLKAVPRIVIEKDCFGMIVYPYDTPTCLAYTEAQYFVDELSLEDMVDIVVGVGMYSSDNKFNMPGSVGNTTSKFWDKGLVNVTLCDGPAGIRIQKRTALIDGKKTKMIDPPLSIYEMMPKFIKKIVMADPNKSTVLYQFTTAFPVSAALAQTWNAQMLYNVGVAIQEEMEEYGCTFWLAPALNIHRNPLCGRNFEYYSEDPLLTGVCATAVTMGVQRKDGYYVTLKHFACNNQEDNRKKVSSNVSERALREIYLRGFEKAVREANAKSVMTSYNKINGVYTANSYDLCTKVLRQEWGFNGVVMTDWFSTSKGCANNAIAMSAGNDLIMPGGKADKKEILDGIKRGLITEADVRRSCERVVQAIMDSALQKEYVNL